MATLTTASRASSIVIGSRDAMRVATGWPVRKDQPEVPLEHVPKPPEVLDGKRLVEAELLQHRRALRAAELAFRPRDDVDDVAWKEADQEEDQDRDAEYGEDGPDHPTCEIAHLP